MKRKTILLITTVLLLLVNFAFIASSLVKKVPSSRFLPVTTNVEKKKAPSVSSARITEIRAFISNNKYSNKYCFIIDMSLPSGSNRFFVYDLKKDSIINSGLVTHGRCNERWLEGRKYNNVVGGGCTSLGKYRIGNPYYGKFGLAYKLHGLDNTNNNAFERYVVLHSHDCVPEHERDQDICQSDGCPTVSPGYLKVLQKIIDGSNKPVLLWIYG